MRTPVRAVILGGVVALGPAEGAAQAPPAPHGLLSQAFQDKGIGETRATRTAELVWQYARATALDPWLVAGVLLTENPDLRSRARSRAGARGLMQVMPFHLQRNDPCGPSLWHDETNVCVGVRVLNYHMRRSSLVRALQRYNGCRACRYPTTVLRRRDELRTLAARHFFTSFSFEFLLRPPFGL